MKVEIDYSDYWWYHSNVSISGALDRMDKYSFVCGEGTVFDQQTLTCNFPEDAFPCEESPSLYGQVLVSSFRFDYTFIELFHKI